MCFFSFYCFVYFSFRSKSIVLKVILKILVVLCIIHYLSICVHVSHNLNYGKTQQEKAFTNKEKQYLLWNDSFSLLSLFLLLLWIGFKNKILLPMIDLVLLAFLMRSIIILFFPMQDPSGICEEKAVSKYSMFEYCGSLRVSGHILPSVILFFFMPRLGTLFILIQTYLIMTSHSHYASDVVIGILMMLSLLYFFQNKFQCRRKIILRNSVGIL